MKLQALGRYRLNGEILGKGNFARVELAIHSVLNTKVAIKIIDVDKVKEDYVRRNLGREVKVLSRLRHPNIVRLFETMMSGHLYCLVMEFAPGGDLCSLVKAQKDGRFPEGRARPFCRQLVSALSYMHGRGIIHRDLKMENIMLNATKDILKIVDFGLSNCWSPESPLKSHCGSPEYAAPELFVVGRTYGPEIDVWSMGVVYYVLLVGRLPFLSSKQEGLSRQERRDKLITHINQGLGGIHRSDMKHLGSECRRLLGKILEPVPSRRLTLHHVTVHPWITHKGLSPLAGYHHPRVGNREHSAAVHHMSEVLSIQPQLIEDRVLKQMYDDIAGMYNILTNKPDVPKTALPEETRIRPLELRTPSKRPLASCSVEQASPLRSDKLVRSTVAPSPKPATPMPARSGVSVQRSGVSLRERPKPVCRRPAHLTRPTTAPTDRDQPAVADVAARTVPAAGGAPSQTSASSVARRRPPPAATALLRSANERLNRQTEVVPRSRATAPPVTPVVPHTIHVPTSARGTSSTSEGSERAWESPRQRGDHRRSAWVSDAPWDTPRRHNLTDDQKVRTDHRQASAGSQRGQSPLLISGADDQFSSLYDDLSDDSSAVDEPIRVVIRRRRPPPAGEVSAATSATIGGSFKPRAGEACRSRTVVLEHEHEQEQSNGVVASVLQVGLGRLDGQQQEPVDVPRPLARKSPSESHQREPKPSVRGQHQYQQPHRRSALPLAKCTLRSPLKTTCSAHAWLSTPGGSRSSGSWSSHDRLDFSGAREGRYYRSHQASPLESKAALKESETQTAEGGWCEEARDSHSEVLKFMVQREHLVAAYGGTPSHKKKFLTPHRLYGNVGRRLANDHGSNSSADSAPAPRGKYRPQTVAATASQEKQRSRVLRSGTVTPDERSRAHCGPVRETRV